MKQIAAAFVKAQRNFAPALKTSTNPHFKSRYADLSACVEAVIDALNENGIALVQHTHEDATGVTVETVFLHESGETMSSGKLHVPAAKQDPQGYGSALTYARRYSLMAACGIAPEDDDGNAASKGKANPLPEASKSVGKADYDSLSLDQKTVVTDIATEIIDEFKHKGDHAAYDMYCEARDSLPLIEEQTALRHLLPSNIRTAFTKIYEGQRKGLYAHHD